MGGEARRSRRVRFLGVHFDNLDDQAVFQRILARPQDAPFVSVVTPNADHVVRIHDEGHWLASIYASAWLCLNDSRVLSALGALRGKPIGTVTGAGLTERLLRSGAITPDTPVCVVGGAAEMVARLKEQFGLVNITHIDPPMGLRMSAAARRRVVEEVERGRYRFTFVAVGSPQQEMLASELQRRGRATGVGLCVGNALNFATGIQQRAPRILQKAALEWAHRLVSEPRRLARRYLVQSPRVLGLWVRDLLGERFHRLNMMTRDRGMLDRVRPTLPTPVPYPREVGDERKSSALTWRAAPDAQPPVNVTAAGKDGDDHPSSSGWPGSPPADPGGRPKDGPPPDADDAAVPSEFVNQPSEDPLLRPTLGEWLAASLASGLAFVFTIFVLVGLPNLVDGPGATNPSLVRLQVFAMFAVASLVLALRADVAVRLLGRTWLFWLAIGICVVSVTWSIYPAATVKRVMILVMLAVTAYAIAVGFRRGTALAGVVLAAMVAILAVEALTILLHRDFAIDYNGVRAAHPSKNLAGFTALVVALYSLGWTAGRRRFFARVFGAGIFLSALAFLVLTESKTSLGLAAVGIGLLAPMLWAWRASPRLGVVSVLVAALATAGFATVIAVNGWDRGDVFTLLVGDPTFSLRTDIWDFVVEDIAKRPVLGHGYGAYWDIREVFDPTRRLSPNSWLSQVEDGAINQAHNGYLDLWVQVGFFGVLTASAAFVFATAASFARAVAAPPKTHAYVLHSTAFVLLACFLLHNLMEASMLSRMIAAGHFPLMLAFVSERLAMERAAVKRAKALLRPSVGPVAPVAA